MKRKSSNKKIVDNSSEKTFSKRYESELKATVKYLKENYGSDVIINHKMSYTYFPRRIKAYSNYAKYIFQLYGDKFKYIDTEKELSFIGSLPFVTNLDILNALFNISLAIAIYILDLLNDSGCLSDAIMYIPSERELLNEVILPDGFHYPTYSNELIKGVIFLIEHRNENACSKKNRNEVFYNEMNINMTNSQDTAKQRFKLGEQSFSAIQSMNYSQRLKYLISFISQNVLVKIEKKFKEKIDYCTMLLLNEFDFIENTHYKQVENESNIIQLSEEQKIALKTQRVFSFIDRNDCGALNTLKSKEDKLKLENPYETCFAAFYLLEYKGDDYSWLIELCGIISEMACNMLPWYKHPNFSSQTEIEYHCVTVNTLNYIYYSMWDGSYDEEYDSRLTKETLCKIVYRKDGYILPQSNFLLRKIMFISKGAFNIIMELCIFIFTVPISIVILLELHKQKDFSILSALLIILLFLDTSKNELRELNKMILRKILIRKIARIPEIGFPKNIDDIKSKEEYEKEIDELSQIVATQKEELTKFNTLLHNATKTIEEQKIQYDSLKSRYDLNTGELAELRETIYKIQNSSELEFETLKLEPHFPYSTKTKILIIGGHEKWASSMKQYIPNAIFISSSSLNFDTAIIKNVDVLWLQTNAMSHSLYYKIIDVARKYNIQIKYFMFPSAKKCAVEIYNFESESTSL